MPLYAVRCRRIFHVFMKIISGHGHSFNSNSYGGDDYVYQSSVRGLFEESSKAGGLTELS